MNVIEKRGSENPNFTERRRVGLRRRGWRLEVGGAEEDGEVQKCGTATGVNVFFI